MCFDGMKAKGQINNMAHIFFVKMQLKPYSLIAHQNLAESESNATIIFRIKFQERQRIIA